MISEVTFSKHYTSFWNSVLINSRNYVRLINGSLVQNIHKPLLTSNSGYTAYINEVAFELFSSSLNKGNLNFEHGDITNACSKAGIKIRLFATQYQNVNFPQYEDIETEVLFIVRSLYNQYSRTNPQIKVTFRGLGLLNSTEIDLSYNKILVEVKSGDRKFKITDIRQILIYLTQNHFSKDSLDIKYIELFNPRMGILFSTDVESMIYQLTASTPRELYEEIRCFLCNSTLLNNEI
ncbi:hypothetical protein [Acinetobacter guillouiae]|uniref:hypothetical protein n=1 Tax=Acinetobacter guillouiae TaxID=106649 RepID=UPI003AF42F26